MDNVSYRATTVNKRSNKDGAIKTGHNDRTFNLSKAEHIDINKICDNIGWTWDNSPTMEDAERNFYNQEFGAGLDAKNARYIKQRHSEKCRTIDDMRRDPKQCPEETILQVGKHGQDIPPEVIKSILLDYVKWEQEQFPLVKTLDYYIHFDEPDAQPHMHRRRVYIGTDKDGNAIPSQNKALKAMGIPLPNPEKPEGRYNNRKIEFDKICRTKFIDICQSYGLTIEVEPQEKSRSGLSLVELKTRTEQEKLVQVLTDKEQAEKALQALEQAKNDAIVKCECAQQQALEASERLVIAQKENAILVAENMALQASLDLSKEIQDAYAKDMGAVSPKVIDELPEKKNLLGKVVQAEAVVVDRQDYYDAMRKVTIWEKVCSAQKKHKSYMLKQWLY